MLKHLQLYSRKECRLCDIMERRLEALRGELGLEWRKVDVDTDAALAARYGERVPVLVDHQGTEICHYRLDETALRKALR